MLHKMNVATTKLKTVSSLHAKVSLEDAAKAAKETEKSNDEIDAYTVRLVPSAITWQRVQRSNESKTQDGNDATGNLHFKSTPIVPVRGIRRCNINWRFYASSVISYTHEYQ
eukprot:GHVT01040303.1.p2 GENE.GHVT01040303.1~~GHVT01040303.1.p2  ORF type:complete len:112 (-),score=11.79 GHVT01040303.1:966-1301(-)